MTGTKRPAVANRMARAKSVATTAAVLRRMLWVRRLRSRSMNCPGSDLPYGPAGRRGLNRGRIHVCTRTRAHPGLRESSGAGGAVHTGGSPSATVPVPFPPPDVRSPSAAQLRFDFRLGVQSIAAPLVRGTRVNTASRSSSVCVP